MFTQPEFTIYKGGQIRVCKIMGNGGGGMQNFNNHTIAICRIINHTYINPHLSERQKGDANTSSTSSLAPLPKTMVVV